VACASPRQCAPHFLQLLFYSQRLCAPTPPTSAAAASLDPLFTFEPLSGYRYIWRHSTRHDLANPRSPVTFHLFGRSLCIATPPLAFLRALFSPPLSHLLFTFTCARARQKYEPNLVSYNRIYFGHSTSEGKMSATSFRPRVTVGVESWTQFFLYFFFFFFCFFFIFFLQRL
jgi:hypothetical protein